MLFHAKRPNSLQYKEATLISYEKCRAKFMPLKKKNFIDWKNSIEAIGEGTLCASNTKRTGCCLGDSGSPVAYNNILIGIVSWSTGCAQGFPDIFTDVYRHLQWITFQMTT